MKPVSDNLQQQYENSVDEWVFDSIKQGSKTFEELLLSLPSVYPTVVLDALRRLASSQRIDEQSIAGITGTIRETAPIHNPQRPASKRVQLPVPHPLDYDWRFSDEALGYLTHLCLSLTRSGDGVILLGVPSVFQMAGVLASSRQIVLLDANSALVQSLAEAIPSGWIKQCDLLRDMLPQIEAPVMVLDPPWYEEHFTAFLWAASRLCALNGNILVGFPPIGTRPGIEYERTRLFEYAHMLGLILIRLEPAALPYISPPFELNSLRAEGVFNFPKHWRRGDLAIFSKAQHVEIPRPNLVLVENGAWSEETIGTVRLRIRQAGDISFADPTLISIVEDDVLPSVSRRDTRRSSVDVWTAGNRVFACRGRNVLRWITHAIATNNSPEAEVIARLRRSLTDDEAKLVSQTVHQITKLVEMEQHEY